MPSQLQSPEIQAFATGFPITLLHAGVTLTMLVFPSRTAIRHGSPWTPPL